MKQVKQPRFEPIHAIGVPDCWAMINGASICYRFMNGMVQPCVGGYWFPYRGNYTAESLEFNSLKAHVLLEK